MSKSHELSVTFSRQPTAALAQLDEGRTWRMIHTLTDWVNDQHRKVPHHRLDLVSYKGEDLELIVLLDWRSERLSTINVCYAGRGLRDNYATDFEPMLRLGHYEPLFSAALADLKPDLFWTMSRVTGVEKVTVDHVMPKDQLLGSLARGHRWGSSEARARFKEFFDQALCEPQILERGEEELIVLSRRYLLEAVSPSGAGEIARKYRNRPLSADGMQQPARRRLSPPATLPDLS